MQRVFPAMGTIVSLRIDDPTVPDRVLADVERRFAAFEDEFSRYQPDSPASRIADGRLLLTRASEEHKRWYAEAVQWRHDTDGAFSPHRPDGTVDLAGIIKAAAIAAAGAVLDDAGLTRWCCNAGGDVLTAGGTADAPWTVGITHPDDPSRLLTTVPLDDSRRAVATSGTSQRGEHIWRTNAADSDYQQVSVTGPDIITVDVLATAILAGGSTMLREAVERWDVHVIAVTAAGDLVAASPAPSR